ncbi:MAG: class I tRNA ligase family protein, partial [Pseudomonadota bacterium]
VLDSLMRLLHPFIPFITDEVAEKLPCNGDTIIRGPFPVVDDSLADPEAEKNMGYLMGLVAAVRNIRAEMGIAPSAKLPVIIVPITSEERALIHENAHMLNVLGRVSDLIVVGESEKAKPPRLSATAVVNETQVFVPLEGVVDPEAETARLEKELAKINKDLSAVRTKLDNEDFVQKAKPEAIEKQQTKRADLEAKSAGLNSSLTRMKKLLEE